MRVSSRASKGQDSRIKYEDQQAEAEAARPRPAKRPRQQRQVAIPAIPLPALPINDNHDNDNNNCPTDRGNIKELENIYWKTYFYMPDDDTSQNILVLLNIMRNYQHL